MSLYDKRGNPVSAAKPAALAHYEQATDLFLGFSGRASEAADAAVAADPGFVMGHCLKAGLAAIANERSFEPQIRPAVEAAQQLAARREPPRARAHRRGARVPRRRVAQGERDLRRDPDRPSARHRRAAARARP